MRKAELPESLALHGLRKALAKRTKDQLIDLIDEALIDQRRHAELESQLGLVRLADLASVDAPDNRAPNPSPPGAARPAETPQQHLSATPDDRARNPAPRTAAAHPDETLQAKTSAIEDIMKAIERLAELRKKDILTEEEFVSKKTELLSRI